MSDYGFISETGRGIIAAIIARKLFMMLIRLSLLQDTIMATWDKTKYDPALDERVMVEMPFFVAYAQRLQRQERVVNKRFSISIEDVAHETDWT